MRAVEDFVDEVVEASTSHGLAFLALLSFVTSFLAARVFATLNPNAVLVNGGIHFHHFWYGLVMVAVAGGLGIGYNRPRFDRAYAVVFGLGGGLVGDEVGLLLTFGNYNSSLTFFFFVVVVTAGIMIMLLLRYEKQLESDVMSLGKGERTIHVGLFVAGLSALAFASDLILPGFIIAATGILVAASGLIWHRRTRQH